MYEYLFAMTIIFVAWINIFYSKREFRKIMLFNGFLYAFILIPLFVIHKLLSYTFDISPLYNPAYWTATTLFDLNNKTGGLSIEDVLFMILFGGLVAILYELLLRKKITNRVYYRKSYAPLIAFMISYIILLFSKINPIYLLILPSTLGGVITLFIRKDLIKNAWISAIAFGMVYFIGFLIFNALFPYFIKTYYNLAALSNIWILGVPIEDILYALSFGFMWGPIYKVINGIPSDNKETSDRKFRRI